MIYITKRSRYKIILDDDDRTRSIVESATYLTINKGGYPVWVKYIGKKNGRTVNETYWLSRMLLDAPDDMQVDHINGNPLDNRLENLRLVSNTQNSLNTKAKSYKKLTTLKGVYLRKDYTPHRYGAQIRIGGGRRLYLGLFDTEDEAHEAYRIAADKYHGEYSFYESRSL